MQNLQPDSLSPAEALISFMAWLTTRPGSIMLGAAHDSAGPAKLVGDFMAVNELAPPRENFLQSVTRWPAPDPAEAAPATEPGPEPARVPLSDLTLGGFVPESEPMRDVTSDRLPPVRTPLGRSGLNHGGSCREYVERTGIAGEPLPQRVPAGETPPELLPLRSQLSDAQAGPDPGRGPVVVYGESNTIRDILSCSCDAPLSARAGRWRAEHRGWDCRECGGFIERESVTPEEAREARGQ